MSRTPPLADIDDNGSVRSRLMRESEGTRPVPDPTLLTTQQLFREITNLKDQIETRLQGYDKAISLLHAQTDKYPSIPEVVAEFREKFRSIDIQFKERDERVAQTSKGGKEALDAALQAAKEAVGEQQKANAQAISKSEAATTKQLDQISAQTITQTKAIDDKIDDLKQRLQTIEATKIGVRDAAADQLQFAPLIRRLSLLEQGVTMDSGRKEGGSAVWAMIGAGLISFVSIGVALITAFAGH